MTNNTRQKFKRTQYLVAAKFQLKYTGIILLLMFITALVCSYIVYYTGMILLVEKLANVYPQGRLVSIINAVNARILLSVLLLTPLVVCAGIYLSHKIAGPIYRIEKFLGSMAKGDIAARLTLRKGDELTSVADSINLLNDSMKATIARQRTSLKRVLSELDDVKKMADSRPSDMAQLDKNIDRLHNEVRDLAKELDWYKV